jgi:divalent metal cation (Fe/Co/Zn/Cd) transporter
VAAGFRLADPIVGLLISVAILRIAWQSAREIGLRALDGIDPEIVDRVRDKAASVPGVMAVDAVGARLAERVEFVADSAVRVRSAG